MFEKISQIFKIKELRKKILFVLFILCVFRFAAHIPISGINLENLRNFFAQNQMLGLLNMFSGGAMENFSVVMLGVAPYITASIIMQLLTIVIPRLEAISKEEDGYKKINQWTRWLTVPLTLLQSYGMITMLNKASGLPIITGLTPLNLLTAIITITCGTIFLMWLGELISEKGIGNGISLIIFAGIIAGVPLAFQRTIATFDPTQILNLFIFLFLGIIVIAGVVIVTEGQRNIPVSYAKRIRGMKMYGGTDTYLPLKVNAAGVIPIIFAISIMLFPGTVAQFFVNSETAWLARGAVFVRDIFANQLFYGSFYFILVVLFTFFYTSIVFHPERISENIQKHGGFIPGIRPGGKTSDYLHYVMTRITLLGAIFLGLIAVLPYIVQSLTGIQTIIVGGTGLLIVVSVVLEMMKQIKAQMIMRDYEGF